MPESEAKARAASRARRWAGKQEGKRKGQNLLGCAQVTTFTDCVNCLIAFTNNPHSLDVSLNAIAFLRFCAMKLAEGAIGAPPGRPGCWVAVVHADSHALCGQAPPST
jgi:hypothetical protein